MKDNANKSSRERGSYGCGTFQRQANGKYELRYQPQGSRRLSKTVEANNDRAAEDALGKWRKELDRKTNPGVKVPCSLLLKNKIAAMRREQLSVQNVRDQELKIQKHLIPVFGHRDASSIKRRDLNSFIDDMLAQEYAPATINRTLANLRSAFNIGVLDDLITDPLPLYTALPENNIRQGFLEENTYREMLFALPPRTKMLFCLAYYWGIRKGELIKIRLEWLLPYWMEDEPIVKIPGFVNAKRVTKSGAPHTLPIYHPDMRAFIEVAIATRDPKCPFLFQSNGKALTEAQYRDDWTAARDAIGQPGLYLHDTRRTAIREMEKAGIPRHDAMQVTGHKTESVYKRYDIASEKGATTTGEKMRGYYERKEKAHAKKLGGKLGGIEEENLENLKELVN